MTKTSVATGDLKNIATSIRKELAACDKACRSGLQHALRAGELLTEARKLVPPDEWDSWCKTEFSVKRRQLQKYGRLFENKQLLEESDADWASHWSIDEALRKLAILLGEPRPPLENDLKILETQHKRRCDRVKRLREGKDLSQGDQTVIKAVEDSQDRARETCAAALRRHGRWLKRTADLNKDVDDIVLGMLAAALLGLDVNHAFAPPLPPPKNPK